MVVKSTGDGSDWAFGMFSKTVAGAEKKQKYANGVRALVVGALALMLGLGIAGLACKGKFIPLAASRSLVEISTVAGGCMGIWAFQRNMRHSAKKALAGQTGRASE